MVQIRAFIAIEISKEAKKEISRIINILKETPSDVKWVNPENLHLTIKFMGSVPEDNIAKISEAIKKTVLEIPKFVISLGELGAFPSWKRPKVIYVDLKEGTENLKFLASRIETGMAKIGFERENRVFKGHITLGRVKGRKNMDFLCKIVSTIRSGNMQVDVNKVFLKRSVLTPDGPVYSDLCESLLNN